MFYHQVELGKFLGWGHEDPGRQHVMSAIVEADRSGGAKMMFRFGGVLVVLALALGACSFEPSRLELLQANPTVSFAEPTFEFGVDGNPDPFIGNPSETRLIVRWDPVAPELVDQGLQELLEQAEAAEFSLEQLSRSEGGGFRLETWEGFNPDGVYLRVRLTEDSLSVNLR